MAQLSTRENQELLFESAWVSPSNIALVKYWGKHGDQLPQNPSVSFTLKNSITEMGMRVYRSSKELEVHFQFEGKHSEKFEKRVGDFFQKIKFDFPEIANLRFEFDSFNTFPHSAGIASSASSMSGLALNLSEFLLQEHSPESKEFLRFASSLARRASGSACRSLYPGIVSWGSGLFEESSDLWGTPLVEVDSIFKNFQDCILIASDSEKKVSSGVGHSLMKNHPYAETRFLEAKKNAQELLLILKTGDLEAFSLLVEKEALGLHAMMMTSTPPYILMNNSSLIMIQLIKKYKEETKIPVCFTLDAGPNIHLLYPKEFRGPVLSFVRSELLRYTTGLHFIDDEVGNGPQKGRLKK